MRNMQQLGMTIWWPALSWPWCHKSNSLYAACLYSLLTYPGSCGSSKPRYSCLSCPASCRIPSSKQQYSIWGALLIQYSGLCWQHFFLICIGMSRQFWQVHHHSSILLLVALGPMSNIKPGRHVATLSRRSSLSALNMSSNETCKENTDYTI